MSIPIRRSQISKANSFAVALTFCEKLKAKGSFSQGLPGVSETPVAQPTRPSKMWRSRRSKILQRQGFYFSDWVGGPEGYSVA
jgi:hypothetical protein